MTRIIYEFFARRVIRADQIFNHSQNLLEMFWPVFVVFHVRPRRKFMRH